MPELFIPTADQSSGIRNNLAFESLARSKRGARMWTATENALFQDGLAASLNEGSPVRVLEYRFGRPAQQFIYLTDVIAAEPVPSSAFKVHGLVELLSIGRRQLLSVERSFSVGVGNGIQVFLTSTQGATNVGRWRSVKGRRFRPMKKTLLLDLATVGLQLDNIEGVTFGPTMDDGSRTLIFVSDNNFNPDGRFTQFLAFRVVE